jgi:hypothetical protein
MMIELIGDALAIYFNVVSAFWQGMAKSGGMQWIIFALAIWWLMGGRARCRCGCGHCGCWCGRCKCDPVRVEDED